MLVTVHVKPGSRKGPLVELVTTAEGEALTVFVQQRAVDGQANTAVVALLAKHFGVAKSSIEIFAVTPRDSKSCESTASRGSAAPTGCPNRLPQPAASTQ